MAQSNRPENDLSGYVYGPTGERHDLLNKWGDVVIINNHRDLVDRGYAWHVSYQFTIDKNETIYIVYDVENGADVHPINRRVTAGDDDNNQLINLLIETIPEVQVDTYGTEITDDSLINSNFNLDLSDIPFKVYSGGNEITPLSDKRPFSGRIKSERRQGKAEFIDTEYVMKNDAALAIKFTNEGEGDLKVVYNADGYIAYAD
ncbi:MAG: hypothetical protein ACLFPS_07870 [Clostridia bacterium]